MNDDGHDWCVGGKPAWCKCMQGTGIISPRRCNQEVLAYFRDEDRRIDLNWYDKFGEWSHITREYILSDAEYFKRKLRGR